MSAPGPRRWTPAQHLKAATTHLRKAAALVKTPAVAGQPDEYGRLARMFVEAESMWKRMTGRAG